MKQQIHKFGIGPVARFSAAILFVLASMSPCMPGIAPEPPPPPPPSDSLLFHIPYVGNEDEFRENPAVPERMVLRDVSVNGWKTPIEKMLRFPVELREGARLSFRLGAATRVPIRIGDLTMRVEYIPEETIG